VFVALEKFSETTDNHESRERPLKELIHFKSWGTVEVLWGMGGKAEAICSIGRAVGRNEANWAVLWLPKSITSGGLKIIEEIVTQAAEVATWDGPPHSDWLM
jgi:hypothetical protein